MDEMKNNEFETTSNFIHNIIDKDLQSGAVTKIHTRFPPEPNGYLHIGSAKAIWINWSIAKKYNGKFNLRYDDTNPIKEDDEFVKAIEQDIFWLTGEKPSGGIFYGSDYFMQCYEYAVKIIKDGKAFVCDLTNAQMSEYRGTLTRAGKESPFKNRTIEENLMLFEKMKNGEFPEGKCTLRAKIDMSSSNMNLRDPIIYRILFKEHHRQGNKWCIYPMYDFAHPIQDALEGISHSLCSIEFDNHRPLYDWVIDNIGIKQKPHQYEFARLNMTNTVMSKRYLRQLVETKTVDSWDDPRMPTLCGMRRRGYTPTAILKFIELSGVSRAISLVDSGLLEFCICEELNKIADRRVAILEPVKVTITNYPENKEEYFEFWNNINPEKGKRKLPFSNEIYIEKADFMENPTDDFFRLALGKEVRLMNAYICKCNEIVKDKNGEIIELKCTVDLETKNNKPADKRKIKGTIHWLCKDAFFTTTIKCYNLLFNDTNVVVSEDEDFNGAINPQSVVEYKNCMLENSLKGATSSEKYQFVRNGYFGVDCKNENEYIRIAPLKSSYKPK